MNRQWKSSGGASFAARLFVVAAFVAIVAITGCNRATPPENAGANEVSAAPAEKSGDAVAREILDRMAATYRKATSYADSGEVRLTFGRPDGEVTTDRADFSVTFERPNKLRMHFYQAVAVSNGEKLQAVVGDLPGQVLTVDAPPTIDREKLYSDRILGQVLTQGIAGESVQLLFLLVDSPLDPILEGATETVLLPPDQAEDQNCFRVQVTRPDGKVVFWVDEKEYILRRLELPTDDLRRMLSQQGPVSDVSVVVDFKGAQINPKIEAVAFDFEVPAGATQTDRFVYVPKLLGQKVPEFSFTSLDGKPVTQESLAGKVGVIDFWATWCSWCFKGLPNVQKVYEQYKDNDRVVFLIVNTMDPDKTGEQAKQAFADASLTLPMVRDTRDDARTQFEVRGLPTMLLVGSDGLIHDIEEQFNPNLAEELPAKIEKLLAGEDVAATVFQQYRDRQAASEAANPPTSGAPAGEGAPATQPADGAGPALGDGATNAGPGIDGLPKAEIAERTEPQKFKLTSLWKCEGLGQPGNMVVLQGEGAPPRVFVLDGWRTVAELDQTGAVKAKHELDLPSEALVSFLRIGFDDSGENLFAASASGQRQVHLFDGQWKKLWSYPTEANESTVSDADLADLDGDGNLDLNVGFWGSEGVQSLSIDGKPRWKDDHLENVFSLTATAPDNTTNKRSLLVVDGFGTIVPIDAQGAEGSVIRINGQFARMVRSATAPGNQQVCAIAKSQDGPESVVGLDATGKQLWTYNLPDGVQHHAALEMLVWGQLTGSGSGEWVVAAPDGSIHILDAQGALVDQFNHGAAISGLAVARYGEGPALIVASNNVVEAWRVAAE